MKKPPNLLERLIPRWFSGKIAKLTSAINDARPLGPGGQHLEAVLKGIAMDRGPSLQNRKSVHLWQHT
eukprot:46202-Eustigmatos_ZCMA.PRE.1